MKVWIGLCFGFIIGVIITFTMPDYTEIGYNNFLLRPLQATFTEQEGIDSITSLDQISGSQVRGDKILSKTGVLSIDLENDLISINDGNKSVLSLGELIDGERGLIWFNIDGDELGKITSKGLFLPNGLYDFQNSKKTKVLDEKGFLVPETIFINGSPGHLYTAPIANGVKIKDLDVNFTLSKRANVLITVSFNIFATAVQGNAATIRSYVDDVELSPYMLIDLTSDGGYVVGDRWVSNQFITTLSEGSHYFYMTTNQVGAEAVSFRHRKTTIVSL